MMVLATRMTAAYQDAQPRDDLRGRRLVTLFAEASTRTRLSFEMAARALGAEVSHLDPERSSTTKGESFVDTVRTIGALGAHLLIVRHRRSGAPWVAARHFSGHVVNAGDGWHAHPTQALLDLYTLRRHLPRGVPGARVTIVGDVRHSRVARSNVWSLTAAGAEVTLCGPGEWLVGFADLGRELAPARRLKVTTDIVEALTGADAVMALRVQRERASGTGPSSAEYTRRYGLTAARLQLADPDAVVLHPGPVNQGVEIAREVSYGRQSAILDQVSNGVPVRMAVLALVASES